MTKRAEGQHEPRPRGFYPTPLMAFEPLAPYLPQGTAVIEPCAGDGALCDHLFHNGCEIMAATDIMPMHQNVGKMNVFDYTLDNTPPINYFVTNPPWPELRKNGEPTVSIIDHLRQIAPSWMLLPADFMHNVSASKLMGFCGGIISVGRVKWIADSKNEGFDNAAWYLFGRLPPPDGKLVFIPRSPKRDNA